jgi:hypothetical protein
VHSPLIALDGDDEGGKKGAHSKKQAKRRQCEYRSATIFVCTSGHVSRNKQVTAVSGSQGSGG